jgi:hypothetical protein
MNYLAHYGLRAHCARDQEITEAIISAFVPLAKVAGVRSAPGPDWSCCFSNPGSGLFCLAFGWLHKMDTFESSLRNMDWPVERLNRRAKRSRH